MPLPLKTHQLWSSFHRVLGDSFLQKLYKVETRQFQRWSADPRFAESAGANPTDRYEVILSRLMELGREDIARAAVSRQARVVGCELRCLDDVIPDRSDIRDEIIDDHPPIAAFHEAVRNAEDPVVVNDLYRKAMQELRETYTLYCRTIGKAEGAL